MPLTRINKGGSPENSSAKLAIKVFSYSDTGIYWTLPLENPNITVAHVCEIICNKLGGDSVVGYLLIIRTKRTIGRPKEIILPKGTLISDIDRMHKKKKKEYTLLLSAALGKDELAAKDGNKVAKKSPKPSARFSTLQDYSFVAATSYLSDNYLTTRADSAPVKPTVLDNSPTKSFIYDPLSKFPSQIAKIRQEERLITPRQLRTSSSAPIPNLTPVAASPVFLLHSPSPTRRGEKALLFGESEFIEQQERKEREDIKPPDELNEIDIDVSGSQFAGGRVHFDSPRPDESWNRGVLLK